MPHVLAWDIETVPNVRGYAAANGLEGKSDDEIRDANGRHNRSKKFDVGVPAVPESGHNCSGRLVQLNSHSL